MTGTRPEAMEATEPVDARAVQVGPGTLIGRYIVAERVGAGGMGVVYAAYDPQLDRRVALKLLLDDTSDAERRARLYREARVMARLTEPHVVAVYDAGEHDGRVFLAMEFVRGRTLRQWLSLEARTWKSILRAYMDAARGLAAAHAAGIVHRDFKPDNVLVDNLGRVEVTDFGLAREGKIVGSLAVPEPDFARLDAVTRHGALLGTPRYMAPEQFAARPCDATTDQFSFCVALWEALYGEPPFHGDTLVDLAIAVQEGALLRPSNTRGVPFWLQKDLARGLSTDPADRWPSLEAMMRAVERRHASTRRRRILALVVGVVAGSGATAGFVQGRRAAAIANCHGLSDHAYSIWPGIGDDRRAAVRNGLLATDIVYASATFEKVVPWLDRYAASLGDARASACLLHDVEHLWDAKLYATSRQCLDEHEATFTGWLDELVVAEEDTLRAAISNTSGLPLPTACLDERALTHQAELAPSHDQDLAALRAQLSKATSVGYAGRHAESMRLASEVVEQAVAIGAVQLEARALLRRGAALERLGRKGEAETDLTRAYDVGVDLDDPDLAGAAAVQLVITVGYERRPAEGRLWARLAEVHLRRLGQASELRMSALQNNLAWVELVAGNRERSVELARHALASAERQQGTEHPEVAGRRHLLAYSLLLSQRNDEAHEEAVLALQTKERAFGPDHPEVAATLALLGSIAHAQGAYREAVEYYRRAVAVTEEASDASTPMLATLLNNLGASLRDSGEKQQAVAIHERALAMTRDKDPAETVRGLCNLANAKHDLGAKDEARHLEMHALALADDGPAGASRMKSLVLLNLGRHQLDTRDLEDAEASFARALELSTAGGTAHDEESLAARVGLARVAIARDRPVEARPILLDAFEQLALAGAATTASAEVQFLLAASQWQLGDRNARTIASARSASEQFRMAGPPAAALLEEVGRWLALHEPP